MADPFSEFMATASQASPYEEALGAGINSIPTSNPTWTANQGYGMNASKAFLSGLLHGYVTQDRTNQAQAVTQILPQLYRDPESVQLPAGVNETAFERLKQGAVAQQAERENSIRDSAIRSLFGNRPGLAEQVLGLQQPQRPVVSVDAGVEQPVGPDLAVGRLSTNKRIIQLSRELQDADPNLKSSQALITARAQVAGEIKANASNFDEAKEARKKADDLNTIVGTARDAINKAGMTGSSLASAYEKTASWLPWAAEAKQQAAADTMLDTALPETIRSGKWPGAMSNYEIQALMKTGPSSINTKESNVQITDKMEQAAKLLNDYADFIETYRDQNSGSTVGASKKWMEYKKDNPLFKKDGGLNTDRTPWQEYFTPGAIEKTPSTAKDSGAPEGFVLVPGKVSKSGAAVYTDGSKYWTP